MGLDLRYIEGQTPLDDDEKDGLLIGSIATRRELDEFEQHNIEQAISWTIHRSFKKEIVLTEAFIRQLHKRMFGELWKRAGEFRKTNKNIGVDKWQIPIELKCLLDDARCWINGDVYDPVEIAIRFKHRLVSVHCFPNGNGRHSRLMADLIIQKLFKQPVFSWGGANLVNHGDQRAAYLAAMKAADAGNIQPLVEFARC